MPISATSDVEFLPGYFVDPWFGTAAWCTLPWPLARRDKDRLIRNSIGPQFIDWAEGRREATDGPGLIHYLTGEPWRFTAGQKRFLILWYAHENGRWAYRSGLKRGAKGTGKDPFAGAMLNGELIGPTQLVWDPQLRRWVGQRHRMPLVQVAANSEAQAKDVLRIANAMLPKRTREHFGIDCGETRTIVEGGGRHEILTASEKSSEGDPATFIALNESHHMTDSNGGHRVAEVARRNVGKSPRELQARLCEFTNAHTPGSDSVAEKSFNAWQAQQAKGHRGKRDILYDSIEAPPDLDIYTDEGLEAFLRAAYADAPWSDLERLAGEVLDPRTSLADTIRYYGNGLAAAEDSWVDPRRFDDLARPDIVVADKDRIALFLDCSKSTDATGLVACRVDDGHVFTVGMWQRPHGDRAKGWLAPREEVDAAVQRTFDRYQVTWFGVDPSPARDDENESLYWMALVDKWHRMYRETVLLWATPGAQIGNAVLFDMRLSQRGSAERNRAFTEAAMQTAKDIDEDAALTHDGDAGLRMHTHNARRRTNQWGVSLGKVTRDSGKLVDLAVCMVGARMGRRLVLNSGKLEQQPPGKRAGKVRGWG